MRTILEYNKSDKEVCFKSIQDNECFFSNGIIYMKILQQDLDHYKINNVNAISVINAGLTFFEPDEKVYQAIQMLTYITPTPKPAHYVYFSNNSIQRN